MTSIKTWQGRTEFNGPCYPREAQEEITDLRAAIERKDVLLRECRGQFEGGTDYPVDDQGYTAAQMQAYGQACRDAALEEAAKECDSTWNGDSDTVDASAAYNECADAIRSLK